MRILVAEDEPVSREIVTAVLKRKGFEVEAVHDGEAAWRALDADDAPAMAVLDWMMPGLDGLELCRRLAARDDDVRVYVIMLTARETKADLVVALEAGADDYLTKPFDPLELVARIEVGARLVSLQASLRDRVEELEASLARVRELQRLLPICSYCRQIRDDQDYWQSIEEYFARNSDVRFSHGICPECYREHWEGESDDPLPDVGRPPSGTSPG